MSVDRLQPGHSRYQQRRLPADVLDLYEIALAKIFDPGAYRGGFKFECRR
jgi:hypothetical protein